MAFLEFTFQSFWHFVGVLILLTIALQSIAAAFHAICRVRVVRRTRRARHDQD